MDRRAIEQIKVEQGISETAAYAMLIRTRLMAPAAALPHVPRQRTPLDG